MVDCVDAQGMARLQQKEDRAVQVMQQEDSAARMAMQRTAPSGRMAADRVSRLHDEGMQKYERQRRREAEHRRQQIESELDGYTFAPRIATQRVCRPT